MIWSRVESEQAKTWNDLLNSLVIAVVLQTGIFVVGCHGGKDVARKEFVRTGIHDPFNFNRRDYFSGQVLKR